MADRPHETRRKLTFRIAPIKPRNPLVAPAMKRAAGPHRRSTSAQRAAGRVALQRALATKDDDE